MCVCVISCVCVCVSEKQRMRTITSARQQSLYVYCLYTHLQVVEDGYEFFARRQLVTLFSAPNYCGDYDNAGGMMTVDEQLFCSFQVCLFELVGGSKD